MAIMSTINVSTINAQPARDAIFQTPGERMTGVLAPTAEEQKKLNSLPRIDSIKTLQRFNKNARSARTLPARVVNIEYLPKVGLQRYGSCVSWAMVYYYKTWQEAKEHDWKRPDPAVDPEHVMSPAFVFNLANAGKPTAGTGEWTNLDYLLQYGACPCSAMEANADPYEWPNEAQMLAAFPQRAQSAATIDLTATGSLVALKAHLATGDLATFSMELHENFSFYPSIPHGVDNEVLHADWGRLHGELFSPHIPSGHELCIIGYDDNKSYVDDNGQAQQGAFLVVNSWSANFGVSTPETGEGGFVWLGYDYFIVKTQWAFIMTDRIDYQPELVGSFHIQHGRRLEVGAYLLGGDRDDPDWEMSVFPRTGGDRSIDQIVAFDATDFKSADNFSWWLRVSDYDVQQFQPSALGFITSFKMKRLDGILWESPDAPVKTIDFEYAWLNASSLYWKNDYFAEIAAPSRGTHVMGDIDDDGDPDLLMYEMAYVDSQWTYAMHCYRNAGDGTFEEIDSGLPLMEGPRALGDYDQDGRPDLACSGYDEDLDISITRIFHNDGDCHFSDTGLTLPFGIGHIEWIDYNNDGRLDLGINEYDAASYTFIGIKVLINNGDGTFTKFDTGVPRAEVHAWADFNRDGRLDLAAMDPIYSKTNIYLQQADGSLSFSTFVTGDCMGAVAVGDVDNDGWLDLAVMFSGDYQQKHKGEVWRNLGDDSFALYGSFHGAIGGSIAWGDMDNDGLADLAVCGDFGDSVASEVNIFTRVYRNKGDGDFQNLGFNLAGVGFITAGGLDYLQWTDYDMDSDLDLIVGGRGARTESYPGVFHLYENRAAQKGGLDRFNEAPSQPGNPLATQAVAGAITFSWDAASDSLTSSGGLYYDLRLGRFPGWDDILAPDNQIPLWGSRLRPQISPTQPGFVLDPAPGTAFYWSVCAIDSAQNRSAWTEPKLFIPLGVSMPGDANADGRIDVSDVVTINRMASGLDTPNPARADQNDDGRVDMVDVNLTRSQILGQADINKQVIAGQSIGPAGGTIETDDMLLTIPAGSFAADYEIWIEKNDYDRPFETSASPMYRIEGIPDDFAAPIEISFKVDSGTTGDVKMALGQLSQPTSSESIRRSYEIMPAESQGGGFWKTTLICNVSEAAAKSQAKFQSHSASKKSVYTISYYVGFITDYGIYSNDHFYIDFPETVPIEQIENLGQALEDAYASFKDTYGFSYSKRTRWPIKVCVYKFTGKSKDASGNFVASKQGDNYGYLNFNSSELSDFAQTKSTAYHEFFHLVQNLYDPRYGFIKAVSSGESLWLAEAASTWSEEIPAAAGYSPPYFDDNNFVASFSGLAKTGGHSKVQDHGYGMSSLIKYFVNTGGNTVPKDIYTRLLAGESSIEAVSKCAPAGSGFSWWGDYMSDFIQGHCYSLDQGQYGQIATSKHMFKIDNNAKFFRSRSYTDLTQDLAGELYLASLLPSGLDADHQLSCRLNQTEDELHRLFVYKTKAGVATELLGEASKSNGALKLDINGLDQLQTEGGWKIMALVTNERAIQPYTDKTLTEFRWAITKDQIKNLPTTNVYNVLYGFPEFECVGTLTGGGWADWFVSEYAWNQVFMSLPGSAPRDYQLSYTATPVQTTMTSSPDASGNYSIKTISGAVRYKMSVREDNAEGPVTDSTSADGTFSFDLDTDDELLLVVISAVYDISETRYDSSDTVISTDLATDVEYPLLVLVMLP
ncbi:MAG: FG-GAP-like repeat-containing protein [Pseudomonadota bacterium]|nr:FG-GAP-like repeat-containing protein [Pseudomonadota bacterium]